MPWEISIVNGSTEQGRSLGTREEVIAAIADALPGVLLQRPKVPPPDMLGLMPPVIREYVLGPNLEATFEDGDLSIQFRANDSQVLDWINCEVRGNGDPRPAFAAVCANRGWVVIDSHDKSVVDLNISQISAWDRFRKWRDAAIRG